MLHPEPPETSPWGTPRMTQHYQNKRMHSKKNPHINYQKTSIQTINQISVIFHIKRKQCSFSPVFLWAGVDDI
jgi:hypothetical protein